MKYSKTTLMELSRKYKQILRKCAFLNAIILMGTVSMAIRPANAATDITIQSSYSSTDDVWTSGSATTSGLTGYKTGDSETYTHWVGAGSTLLDDTLTLTGGSLTTSGLTQNGALYASGGSINVSSGALDIASGSSIANAVGLTVASGANLNVVGGNVAINSGDNVNRVNTSSGTTSISGGSVTTANTTGGTTTISGGSVSNVTLSGGTTTLSGGAISSKVTASAGTLNVTGGNHTMTNASEIGGNTAFSITNGAKLTANNATITINGSDNVSNGSLVTNGGTLNIEKDQLLQNNTVIADNTALNVSSGKTLGVSGNAVVNVNSGDSISNATMNVAGGTLLVNGGTHDIHNSSTVTSGTLAVTGGNVDISDATISGGNFSVSGGDVDIYEAAFITGGNFSVTGGDVDVKKISSIASLSTPITKGAGTLTLNSEGTTLVDLTNNINTVSVGESSGTIVLHNLNNNAVISGNTNDVIFRHTNGYTVENKGIVAANNLYVGDGVIGANLYNMKNISTALDLVVRGNSSFENNSTGSSLSIGHDLIIEDGGKATIANLGNTTIGNIIRNAGSLEFAGGTNTNAIDGVGTDPVDFGSVLFNNTNNEANVRQYNVEFRSTSGLLNSGTIWANTFANNTTLFTNNGTLTVADQAGIGNGALINNSTIGNNGTLNLYGTDMTVGGIIDGEGATNIGGTVTFTGTSLSNDIAITGALTADANKIYDNKDGVIANDGTLTLTGGTNIDNAVIHANAVSGAGKTVINGFVTQTAGKAIASTSTDADAISIASGKGLIANASDLQAKTTNAGALKLVGGTLATDVTGTGTTTVDGEVAVDDANGSIAQAVTVNATKKLTANATNITGAVANSGTYEITGGDIKANITSTGTTKVTGTVTNTTDSTIANTVTIVAADDTVSPATAAGSLTTTASAFGNTVTNNGALKLTAGTLAQNVTGDGITEIAGTVDVDSDNSISQAIKITSGGLTANTSSIGGFVNNAVDGGLTLTGGTLAQDVAGTGRTIIDGDVTIGAPVSIAQAMTINAGKSLTAHANKLTKDITNNGSINLMGGTVGNKITGGTLNIKEDITVGSDDVNVASTVIDSGKKLTIGTHTFTSTDITNNGTIDVDIDSVSGSSYQGTHLAANTLTNTAGIINLNVDSSVLDVQHAEGVELTLVQGLTTGLNGTVTINNSDYAWTDKGNGKILLTNTVAAADTTAAQAGSANNMSTAIGIDNALGLQAGTMGREVQKQLNRLSQTNPTAYTKALTDLAPTDSATLTGMTLDLNNQLDQQIANRLGLGRSGGDVFEKRGVWAQALYNHSKQDRSSKTAGFSGDTTGISFGLDGNLNDQTTIGIGYAYAQSDVDSAGRSTDIDSHNFFAYGKYQPSEWYVKGMMSYGMASYEEKANILGYTNKSKYDVNNYGLRAYVGYDFANGITPEGGLRYTYLTRDTYTDTLGQRVKTDDVDVLTAVLGVNYATTVETKGFKWSPKAHLAATYDLTSDNSNATVNIGSSVYDIKGNRLNRWGVETGIAAEMTLDNWDFSLGYDLGIRKDYQSHTGTLKAKYNF